MIEYESSETKLLLPSCQEASRTASPTLLIWLRWYKAQAPIKMTIARNSVFRNRSMLRAPRKLPTGLKSLCVYFRHQRVV